MLHLVQLRIRNIRSYGEAVTIDFSPGISLFSGDIGTSSVTTRNRGGSASPSSPARRSTRSAGHWSGPKRG